MAKLEISVSHVPAGTAFTFTDRDGTEYQLVWRGANYRWLLGIRPIAGEWSTTYADAFPATASHSKALGLVQDFANDAGYFSEDSRRARIAAIAVERERQMTKADLTGPEWVG